MLRTGRTAGRTVVCVSCGVSRAQGAGEPAEAAAGRGTRAAHPGGRLLVEAGACESLRGTRNLLCEVYQGRVHHLRARTFCATHAKGVVLFTPPTTATYAPGVAFSNPVDLSAGSSCTRPVPSSRVACLLLPRATTTPSSHTRVPRSAAPPPATRDASMRVLPSCCPGAAIARRGRAARGAYCRPSKNRQ